MKIWASIEHTYVKCTDGYYQEFVNHYVHFRDASGNTQTKLDRSERGRVFTENVTHNSFSGVVTIKENGVDKRLVAVQR